MSRVFSVPTALRQFPNELLRWFLERLGHGVLNVPWENLKHESGIVPSTADRTPLSPGQFDAVDGALRPVFDLACPTGIAAVRGAGVRLGDTSLPDELPQEGSLYEQAMWAWLNRRDAVDDA